MRSMTTKDDLPGQTHQAECALALKGSVGVPPRNEPTTCHQQGCVSQPDRTEVTHIAATCNDATAPREQEF